MHFSISSVLLALTGARLVTAYLVDPPTEAAPDTVSDCSLWHEAKNGDQCPAVAANNGISLADFQNVYNPSLAGKCSLVPGRSYCVERNYGVPPEPPTTATSSAAPTSTGNGVSTPTPTQTGLIGNCKDFYYVKSGDTCAAIASAYGIELNSFYAWNTGVGAKCQFLWVDTWYCVGLIGQVKPTITTTSSATTTGNGISTPTPTQSGLAPNCRDFYYVKPGDYCASIAAANGIDLASFYAWNTGVGDKCQNLWADTWYCVGLIGSVKPTTSIRPSSTSTGNGIPTPTPYQDGMTPNCDRFYLVKPGDGCQAIADKSQITLAQFYAWNRGVGDKCQVLWADAYVCIHAFK